MSAVCVLVGAPGAGKTTVGRLVAAGLGVGFRDTDADVEAATGRSIAELFVDEGEAAFRALERDAVRAALDEHDGILAVGGGAVLDAGTRALLATHTVVHLDVTLADAVRRTGMGNGRPLLTMAVNPRATLAQLLDARRPLYAEVADIVVGTEDRSAADVAAEVLRVLQEVRA